MRISDWSSDVCSSDLEPMFAVVKTGGKQYKVAAGDVIKVEKLVAEAGATVELDQVLMVGDEGSVTVGAPTVAGASVAFQVLEQAQGPKVISFRSEERRVGKEGVSKCCSRWSPNH